MASVSPSDVNRTAMFAPSSIVSSKTSIPLPLTSTADPLSFSKLT